MLQYGVLLGSAGQGRIASAARADYAEAAAALLTRDEQAGCMYELAGDESYTLGELAHEIARQSGQAVAYRDLPESEFKAAVLGAGLPMHRPRTDPAQFSVPPEPIAVFRL